MELERDLDGEFIKVNNITKLIILDEPKNNENGFTHTISTRVQCNDTKKTIAIWTLNKQSKNALIDKFGGNTKNMVSKEIPIVYRPYGRDKYTINVNNEVLMKNQSMIVE